MPVNVDRAEEIARAHPSPSRCWIHDLKKRTDLAPDEDKVRVPRRQTRNDDGRQRGLIEREIVGRKHDLLRVEADFARNELDRVDRCAIESRLTRFAQTSVTDADAEAFEQRLERSRSAIDRGCLNRLRNDKTCAHPAIHLAAGSMPAARSNTSNGERHCTSTVTVAGKP
ncbi:MAG: hypothetical protein QOK37_4788 [Thermoanaerobaculia bacterium]|nr:hypothetical protein [Thermoanaerobaculia bacterium]